MLNIDVRRQNINYKIWSDSLLGMLNIDVRRPINYTNIITHKFARYVEYRC